VWGTTLWIVLLALALVIEALSRLGRVSTPTLARTGALMATRVTGRVLLILFWLFVGLHLFTRYTLPGH
jgi:hypothetical protein